MYKHKGKHMFYTNNLIPRRLFKKREEIILHITIRTIVILNLQTEIFRNVDNYYDLHWLFFFFSLGRMANGFTLK